MPNKSTDALFLLIKSLEKSEKRHFKLYVNRNTSAGDLKIVQLFDALEGMDEYDEELLLKKNKGITKLQLSNIKASLYKELLASIRLLKSEVNIDIQLHEQLDYAKILYNKGLYLQSLKLLDKIKEQTKAHNQVSFLVQVLFLEKKIESLHITRSMQNRADMLCKEVTEANYRLTIMGKLSNLALQLYSWYIKNGHARNKNDEVAVQQYFNEHLDFNIKTCEGFYEKLYLYQSYCWYAFIRQDYLMYYRYTQKWVSLFEKEPFMIEIETTHYIKGMHNLMGAHFDLQNDTKFLEVLHRFETFSQSPLVTIKENNRIQTLLYLYIAKINQHFLHGTFSKGLGLVADIEHFVVENRLYIDKHRILVLYYKIASLYFGSGDYDKAIDYLNKIINLKVDLRTDIQCYARLLHLIAHYEIGNFQLLEYLIKSVYRFMAKMDNLSVVEEAMFKFLKKSFSLTPSKLPTAFQKLLLQLKRYEHSSSETRAFAYLDIISWLESKIEKVPVQDIIRKKYLAKNKRVI